MPNSHPVQVVLAMVLIQVSVSTVYYFSFLKSLYIRLVNQTRRPVFDSSNLPARPLRALVGTAAASLALTGALNFFAIRFGVDTLEEGLHMAAALLVMDTCLNARHHFFEGRPLGLFLLHFGYHAILLTSTCCILSVFGQPASSRAGSNSVGGGSSIAGSGSSYQQQHLPAAAAAALEGGDCRGTSGGEAEL